jgi:two-component system sensor histidine kinase RegB
MQAEFHDPARPSPVWRVPGGSHAVREVSPVSPTEAVLEWLVPLRFLSAAGQAVALLAARELRDLPLPYAWLWLVPLATLASNLPLLSRRLRRRLPARSLVLPVLLLDCALFTLLLRWSGGPDNPFSALYIIPVAMAAMTGSLVSTWAVAAAAAVGYGLVFLWHEPQHFWHEPLAPGFAMGLHAVGMWVAVAVVAVVITFFLNRVTRTLRERDAEMRRLGEIVERNARLASLTTLAAGAAHELGSPLGTIAVIARDLQRACEPPGALPSLAEDARLLRSEVERCRAILDRMRSRAADEAVGPAAPLCAGEALPALREALGEEDAGRVVGRVEAPDRACLGARSDFLEVVLPILRNALDASPPDAEVRLDARLEGGRLRIEVRDRGHGMDEATLERVSEPFFTTRAPGRGTGLGLFVVNLHVERLGGSLRLTSAPGRGTTATVEWPLAPAATGGPDAGEKRLAS